MLHKVARRDDGEYVLDSDDPDGIRICGTVNPENTLTDYVGRFDITGYPFRCVADHTSNHLGVVDIKRGDKGQVIKYDHLKARSWVRVVFKLDNGTLVCGNVPIAYLAISTTHLLEDWLGYCKQDTGIHGTAAQDPVSSVRTAFTRVHVGNEMDVYFRGLSTVTQIETKSVIKKENEFHPKSKLYYGKRCNNHSRSKYDLVITTYADVGPPVGTQGYFLAEIMRHGTPHPYCYCTTGELRMWSIEKVAKRLAFAFLYEADDGWKKMYFRAKKVQLLDNNVRRSISYIFIASSFMMFLQRLPIPRNWQNAAWIPNYGIADIWYISFEHVNINQGYTAVKDTQNAISGPLPNLLYREKDQGKKGRPPWSGRGRFVVVVIDSRVFPARSQGL